MLAIKVLNMVPCQIRTAFNSSMLYRLRGLIVLQGKESSFIALYCQVLHSIA